MLVEMWSFQKRRNSTKIPDVAAPWSPEVNLKAPTSLLNPTLLMGSEEDAAQIDSYNYMRMNGKYYFIDEWTSVRNDLWEAKCRIDLLASYKDEILATSAYITYDTVGNSDLVDNRLSILSTPTVSGGYSVFASQSSAAGTYIFSVVGSDGSVDNYATNKTYLNRVLNNLDSWLGGLVSELTDPIDYIAVFIRTMCGIGNAAECIRACTWLPWTVEGGGAKDVYLGTYPTGVTMREITDQTFTFTTIAGIPWQYGDWRDSSPFTQIYVFIPFIGFVSYNASQLKGTEYIYFDGCVDVLTGNMSVKVYSQRGEVLGTYGGSTAVSVPVGVSNVTPNNISNAIGSVGGGMIGLALGGVAGIASAAGGVMSGLMELTPNLTTIGGASNASGIGIGTELGCWTVCHNTSIAPSAVGSVMGIPSATVKTLSTLTGYVRTMGVSVSAAAGAEELSQINSMLDGGIFIE